MKTNAEVARDFARGRNAKGGNIASSYGYLYSYSTKIAAMYGGVILMTCDDYSATTARHKLHLRRAAAAAGDAIFEVPAIDNTTTGATERNRAYLRNLVEFWRGKMDRARNDRTRVYYRRQMDAAADNVTAFEEWTSKEEGAK
jgi:hypothetical protein